MKKPSQIFLLVAIVGLVLLAIGHSTKGYDLVLGSLASLFFRPEKMANLRAIWYLYSFHLIVYAFLMIDSLLKRKNSMSNLIVGSSLVIEGVFLLSEVGMTLAALLLTIIGLLISTAWKLA